MNLTTCLRVLVGSVGTLREAVTFKLVWYTHAACAQETVVIARGIAICNHLNNDEEWYTKLACISVSDAAAEAITASADALYYDGKDDDGDNNDDKNFNSENSIDYLTSNHELHRYNNGDDYYKGYDNVFEIHAYFKCMFIIRAETFTRL